MMVKNIDTCSKSNEDDSRLQYWVSLNKRRAKVCSAKSCINRDVVGALVEKNEGDKTAYIVPLCHMHSKIKDNIELITGTRLIRAD